MAKFIEVEFSKEEPVREDFGVKFGKLFKVSMNVEKINAFTFFTDKGYGVLETEKDLLYIEKSEYDLLTENLIG